MEKSTGCKNLYHDEDEIMKYKYNIKHKHQGDVTTINFKNKESMIKYLDTNKQKLNKMISPVLNFAAIMLPLKHTVWFEE